MVTGLEITRKIVQVKRVKWLFSLWWYSVRTAPHLEKAEKFDDYMTLGGSKKHVKLELLYFVKFASFQNLDERTPYRISA